MKNVMFRADASDRIGTGHVMRCLALADRLRARGTECCFIHRLHPGHMAETIRARGHLVTELPTPANDLSAADADYDQWLGVDQVLDAEQSIEALEGTTVDWVVIDHYSLDFSWEELLSRHSRHIAVVDDLANRRHKCDLLLDQNYFPDAEHRYDGLVPEKAHRLCGPRYALLRPEYAEARRLIGPRRGPLSRVLIYYGGSDISNETGRALRVLSQPEFSHLAVDVVIGVNNRHWEQLIEQARQRPLTDIHGSREHLTDLMIEADVAMGAGGATTWERFALGLPSIVTAVADNQAPFNSALANDGLIHYLGYWSEVSDTGITEALRGFVAAPTDIQETARRIWRVSDGLGALRVAESLFPSNMQDLSLRSATQADKVLYFNWANDPDTRRHAHNPKPITWSDHDRWFDKHLSVRDSCLWILIAPSGLPVGEASVEVQDSEALLVYSIDVAFRGRRWGMRLLELVSEEWRVRGSEGSLITENRPMHSASRDAYLRINQNLPTIRHSGNPDYSLTVLSDRESWMNEWIPSLLTDWLMDGHRVRWVHHPDDLQSGDVSFFLGCGQLVRPDLLSRHSNNLVVHGSEPPKGRGWSPLTWQILEGASRLPVTLLEAVAQVDAGDIYLQDWFELEGHELIDELRAKQAEVTLNLCRQFVVHYPTVLAQARAQTGEPIWYPRRTWKDSELDPGKTLADQFNLLRVVDNLRYPAYFDFADYRYTLTVQKDDE